VVFEALSFWGNGGPYFLAFFVMFILRSRARAFYYVMFLTACGFLMNITKMAYHEPRPFMFTQQIRAYGCSAEYGNPSGHSLFAAAFNFFFYLDICHNGVHKVSLLLRNLLLFAACSLTFLIGFARFYVGVHTLNQIIYGWQLGLALAFYFHYCLRTTVMSHINFILLKQGKTDGIPYGKYILISTLLAAVAYGGQILTYVLIQMVIEQGNEE
jgi:membrane-associated phospholipid phosphatase